jgi:hypothetical protein
VDVWTYFEQRERECESLSLVPDGHYAETVSEEVGSDGMRGRVFGRFWMMDDPPAYLAVSEVVVVTENDVIHREEYGYFLVIDGEEVRGWERDLSHDPAVHRHTGPGHDREDTAEPIAFRDAVEIAWEEITRRLGGVG